MDSRASVTSLWSTDVSRRDSEAIIPEDEVEESSERSFASAGSGGVVSSDNTTTSSRRHSEIIARRRRSSARSAQVRRHTRRFPLTYDRRRTTGRFVTSSKSREIVKLDKHACQIAANAMFFYLVQNFCIFY